MMTLDTIDKATRAAFKQRYHDRPFHRFDSQPFPIQCRWTLVCAKVLNGEIRDGKTFREKYLDGIGAPDRMSDKTWDELSRRDRYDWDAVYQSAARHSADPVRITQAVTRTMRTEARAA